MDEGWPAPPASRITSQPVTASTAGRPADELSSHDLLWLASLQFSTGTAPALMAVLDFTVRSFSLLRFHFRAECMWGRIDDE